MLTKRLVETGEIVRIEVVDHIVIGDKNFPEHEARGDFLRLFVNLTTFNSLQSPIIFRMPDASYLFFGI